MKAPAVPLTRVSQTAASRYVLYMQLGMWHRAVWYRFTDSPSPENNGINTFLKNAGKIPSRLHGVAFQKYVS
jgi:hypothetical protein